MIAASVRRICLTRLVLFCGHRPVPHYVLWAKRRAPAFTGREFRLMIPVEIA